MWKTKSRNSLQLHCGTIEGTVAQLGSAFVLGTKCRVQILSSLPITAQRSSNEDQLRSLQIDIILDFDHAPVYAYKIVRALIDSPRKQEVLGPGDELSQPLADVPLIDVQQEPVSVAYHKEFEQLLQRQYQEVPLVEPQSPRLKAKWQLAHTIRPDASRGFS
ncbi:hypothetical protein HAX54_012683 [Datura stramonium]|uniref:Uncharacterized protein n=1 Tax=Datura stramonium TaxID=4076 RepID=A0ABS8Y1A3_DATST|nr:hypothetical protein [Datura stramonium]